MRVLPPGLLDTTNKHKQTCVSFRRRGNDCFMVLGWLNGSNWLVTVWVLAKLLFFQFSSEIGFENQDFEILSINLYYQKQKLFFN